MFEELSYEKLTIIGGLLVALIISLRLSLKLVDRMMPLTQAIHSVTQMAAALMPDVKDVKTAIDDVKGVVTDIHDDVGSVINKVDEALEKMGAHESAEVIRLAGLKEGVAGDVESRFKQALELQGKDIVKSLTHEMGQMQIHFYTALAKAIRDSEEEGVAPQEAIRIVLRFLNDMSAVGMKALSTAPLSPIVAVAAEKKTTNPIESPPPLPSPQEEVKT